MRVGAFSAIFVLFESRWVMWSCCSSVLLSLGHQPRSSFFNNKLSDKARCWKRRLEKLQKIISKNNIYMEKYPELLQKAKSRFWREIISYLNMHLSCSTLAAVKAFHREEALIWQFVQASNYCNFSVYIPLCSTLNMRISERVPLRISIFLKSPGDFLFFETRMCQRFVLLGEKGIIGI